MKRKLQFYGFLFALGAVAALVATAYIGKRNAIERRFADEIQDVRGNAGDVLEVATLDSMFSASESDPLEVSVLGVPINLGTTEVYLKVPVRYRFHILLSGPWKIEEHRDYIQVVAPRLLASQPPAPDLSGAEYLTKTGWARFNRDDVKKRLDTLVSPTLRLKATQFCTTNIVRDRARESVAGFLRQRFGFLDVASRTKLLVIRFEDEPESAKTGKVG